MLLEKLTVRKIFTKKGIISTAQNVYTGEEEVKKFLRSQAEGKKAAEKPQEEPLLTVFVWVQKLSC